MWTRATFSLYPATINGGAWLRLDNVVLRHRPAVASLGTGCYEPGAIPAGVEEAVDLMQPTLEPTATAMPYVAPNVPLELPLFMTPTPMVESQSFEGTLSE